jgi:hypothetical protein
VSEWISTKERLPDNQIPISAPQHDRGCLLEAVRRPTRGPQ